MDLLLICDVTIAVLHVCGQCLVPCQVHRPIIKDNSVVPHVQLKQPHLRCMFVMSQLSMTKRCCAVAEGDHVTRILKAYGDALEGAKTQDAQQGPALSKGEVSSQEMYLRCVVLLVRLTGKYVARFLPQVRLPTHRYCHLTDMQAPNSGHAVDLLH